jgi:hypothetical protein
MFLSICRRFTAMPGAPSLVLGGGAGKHIKIWEDLGLSLQCWLFRSNATEFFASLCSGFLGCRSAGLSGDLLHSSLARCYLFTHEAHQMEIAGFFFREEWWRSKCTVGHRVSSGLARVLDFYPVPEVSERPGVHGQKPEHSGFRFKSAILGTVFPDGVSLCISSPGASFLANSRQSKT